jgi:hypothetical protein
MSDPYEAMLFVIGMAVSGSLGAFFTDMFNSSTIESQYQHCNKQCATYVTGKDELLRCLGDCANMTTKTKRSNAMTTKVKLHKTADGRLLTKKDVPERAMSSMDAVASQLMKKIDADTVELLLNHNNVSWYRRKLKEAEKALAEARYNLEHEPNIDLGGPSGGCTHNIYRSDIEQAQRRISRCKENIARLESE